MDWKDIERVHKWEGIVVVALAAMLAEQVDSRKDSSMAALLVVMMA